MPVFRNSKRNEYALVAYKVLYSKFSSSPDWRELGLYPTPRLLAKAILKDRCKATYLPVRSPYDRTISCFMDKFRKQPTRIREPGFEWQACHRIFYPFCGIREGDADGEIAAAFLKLSFDHFLELLPEVYEKDGHFHPQSWNRRLKIGRKNHFHWPNCKVIKVENPDDLNQVPDIDWSVKTNFTHHIERDFTLSEKNKMAIRNLYGADFELGGYSF